jgi:hypothetical protein
VCGGGWRSFHSPQVNQALVLLHCLARHLSSYISLHISHTQTHTHTQQVTRTQDSLCNSEGGGYTKCWMCHMHVKNSKWGPHNILLHPICGVRPWVIRCHMVRPERRRLLLQLCRPTRAATNHCSTSKKKTNLTNGSGNTESVNSTPIAHWEPHLRQWISCSCWSITSRTTDLRTHSAQHNCPSPTPFLSCHFHSDVFRRPNPQVPQSCSDSLKSVLYNLMEF